MPKAKDLVIDKKLTQELGEMARSGRKTEITIYKTDPYYKKEMEGRVSKLEKEIERLKRYIS